MVNNPIKVSCIHWMQAISHGHHMYRLGSSASFVWPYRLCLDGTAISVPIVICVTRQCRDKEAWVRLSECLARRIHQLANLVPAHSRFMSSSLDAYLWLPNELMTLFRPNISKNISLDNIWHYINAPPISQAALPMIFRSQCLPSHYTLISSHSSVRLCFECFYPSQTPSWSPERWLWRCCWYEFHNKVRNLMTDYFFQVWGSSLQPSCSSWPRFNANSSNFLLLLRKNSRYDIFQRSFYSNC